MYEGSQVGLVIIAYNEEPLIRDTLDNVPSFIDHVIVVNDCSTDKTRDIVNSKKGEDNRIHLLKKHLE